MILKHKAGYILNKLVPQGGWVVYGDDYSGIVWSTPENAISQEEFDAAMANYDQLVQADEQEKQAKEQAALSKLSALGLTVDDIRTIVGI